MELYAAGSIAATESFKVRGSRRLSDVEDVIPSLRLRASDGDAKAQFILGLMYDNGRGVPQDFVEAAKWYRKAAYQCHAEAQFNLGTMHINGDGVAKDYVLAHMWFSLAAEQKFENAAEYRDMTASLMTSKLLSDAHRLKQGWKARAEK